MNDAAQVSNDGRLDVATVVDFNAIFAPQATDIFFAEDQFLKVNLDSFLIPSVEMIETPGTGWIQRRI